MNRKVVALDSDHISTIFKQEKDEEITQAIKNDIYDYFQNNKGDIVAHTKKNLTEYAFRIVPNVHDYVMGVPGSGKTYLVKEIHKALYPDNIKEFYTLLQNSSISFDVINANKIREDIAEKAERIIIIDRPNNIVEKRRIERGQNDDFYNFGRKENATLGTTYSIEITKALMKQAYPEKTFVIQDPIHNILIPITDIDTKPISKEGIIEIPLKGESIHIGHEGLFERSQEKSVLMAVMREKELFSALSDEELLLQIPEIIHVMIATEGIFTIQEKIKLIETNNQLRGKLVYGYPLIYNRNQYYEVGNRIIQKDYDKTIMINGKDRLPDGFDYGGLNHSLLQNFITDKEYKLVSSPVKNAIGRGITMFIKAGDKFMSDGSYVSSTRFREELLKEIPNVELIEKMFSPSVANIIIDPRNLRSIAERLLIEQELKNLSSKIDEENQGLYVKKYSNIDLFYKKDTTTAKRGDQKGFFDARIVSTTDPLCIKKKEYIVTLNKQKKKNLSERKAQLREERGVRNLIFGDENNTISE